MHTQNLAKTFTKRQWEIISLASDGKSNTEIAKILNVSVDTIRGTIKLIYKKMSVGNRVQMAVKAIKEGIIL